jgi:hypothetical protein
MAKPGTAIIISVFLFLAAASADAFVAFPRTAGYDRLTKPTLFPTILPGNLSPQLEGDRVNSKEPTGGAGGINGVVAAAPVPEPATVVMVGLGLASIGMARRKFLR